MYLDSVFCIMIHSLTVLSWYITTHVLSLHPHLRCHETHHCDGILHRKCHIYWNQCADFIWSRKHFHYRSHPWIPLTKGQQCRKCFHVLMSSCCTNKNLQVHPQWRHPPALISNCDLCCSHLKIKSIIFQNITKDTLYLLCNNNTFFLAQYQLLMFVSIELTRWVDGTPTTEVTPVSIW